MKVSEKRGTCLFLFSLSLFFDIKDLIAWELGDFYST